MISERISYDIFETIGTRLVPAENFEHGERKNLNVVVRPTHYAAMSGIHNITVSVGRG